MKLLFVFGTRPEAIKMATVIRAASALPRLSVRVCVTGQHRAMLDQMLEFFCLRPDYDLDVMRPGQDLGTVTARVLERLRPVLVAEKPDAVVVQGDTVSAFAGSLGAFYERIPVAHIEAGLRTYDLGAPFPEEALRQMVARLAEFHFAPTEANVKALIAEGISANKIYLTGNPGIDAVRWTRDKIRQEGVNPLRAWASESVVKRIADAGQIVLVTGHRRENFGAGLRGLCAALGEIAERHPAALVVYALHPNPNVEGMVRDALGTDPKILLLPPLDYRSFVYLMDRSALIITDSGGVQEEAPALGKRVLVTRSGTERREALASGLTRIVGTDPKAIVDGAVEVLRSGLGAGGTQSPFGDGRAGERIARVLAEAGSGEGRQSRSLLALMAAVGYRDAGTGREVEFLPMSDRSLDRIEDSGRCVEPGVRELS